MRRAAVLTVSNRASAGVYRDEAGPLLVALLSEAGFAVDVPVVVPDGLGPVSAALLDLCERAELVVTTGGTGVHPNDVTPEATLSVIDRAVPGLAELMRASSLVITPMAALSRAVVGIRGRTMIVNLPGSPKGARENLEVVLPVLGHALDQLAGGDHG